MWAPLRAAEKFQLAADVEPTEEQLDATELELMQAATKPFRKAALRKVIQSVWEDVNSQWQVVDEITRDNVIRAEFDPKAKADTDSAKIAGKNTRKMASP